MNPTSTAPDDSALAEILDELTARLQRGERVHEADVLAQYPDFAEPLRELFPALRMLGDLSQSRPDTLNGLMDSQSSAMMGTLGDFRLLREVGRGGMGVVYEAEQITLGRRVALKILPFAATMDPRQLQRFQNEVRAAASLHHEHIVPVYTVGCERGLNYFAMQYIDGKTLAEMLHELNNQRPLEERTTANYTEVQRGRSQTKIQRSTQTVTAHDLNYDRHVAELGVQAALALEHAHRQGIVHRDIKPANLMIDSHGKLWVTDFGLARIGGSHDLTASGDVIGTLRYMSPEQALAKHNLVDHRTDIYSLGVTLYELLTLSPAIRGQDRHELLKKIAFEEPPRPRTLVPDLPRELETIVLKATAKDSHLRYQSAEELADDLRCYLNDQPIKAKRTTAWQLLLRWRRRNPALACALLCLFAVIVLGNVLVTWKWRQERESRSAAQHAEAQAREQATALQRSVYFQGIARSDLEWWANNVERAAQELEQCPKELRHWEWGFLKRLCHSEFRHFRGHQGMVRTVAFAPDGKYLASAGNDRTIRFWDLAQRQEVRTLKGHTSNIWSIAFSPDGRHLVSAAGDWVTNTFGEVKIWDTHTGQELGNYPQDSAMVDQVIFSPDGRTVTFARWDGTICFLNPATGQIRTQRVHQSSCKAVMYSPDGQYLVTGAHDATIRVWEVANMRLLRTLTGHGSDVLCMAYSPDGSTIASASWDHSVRIWNPKTGQLLSVLTGHTGPVDGIAFSPDGKQLASSSTDGTSRLWDTNTWKEAQVLRVHDRELHGMAYSPGGRAIATAGWDGTVNVWDLPHRQLGVAFGTGRSSPRFVCFHPNGKRFVLNIAPARQYQRAGFLEWHDAHTGQFINNMDHRGEGFTALAFNHDGTLFVADDGPHIQLYDGMTGTKLRRIEGQRSAIVGLVFHPHEPTLFSLARDGSLHAWNSDTGEERRTFTTPFATGSQIALSDQGDHLAVTADDGQVAVWDVRATASTPTHVWSAHQGAIHALAFQPLGSRLATAGQDGHVRLWERGHQGKERFDLQGHVGPVYALSFSPDGRRLASGGNDGTVVMWDAQHGLEALTLRRQLAGVSHLAFSPNGNSLVATSREFALVRMWFSGEATEHEQQTREQAWHRAEAMGAVNVRQWSAAIHHWSWLLANEPSNAQYCAHRGYAHAELGHTEEAIADYRRAIDTPGAKQRTYEYVSHCTNYALLLLHHGDRRGYLEQCHRLAQEFHDSRDHRVIEIIARCFRLVTSDAVDVQPGIAFAERMAWANPKEPSKIALRGMIYYRAGRYAEALQSFSKAGQWRGDNRDGDVVDWLWYALAYGQTRYPAQACVKLSEAVAWMEQYLDRGITPPSWSAPPTWVQRLELTHLRREAEQLLAVPERHLSRPELLKKARAEEIQHLNNVLLTDGPNVPDLLARANNYAELGEWKLAAADFATLTKMQPAVLMYWYRWVAAQGGTNDAHAYQQACVSMFKQFEHIQSPGLISNMLYVLTMAPQLPCDRDRWLELGAYAENALVGNQRLMGAVRYRAGQYAAALKSFEQAQPLYSRRAWDWCFLAMIHHHLGHTTEAKNCLRRANDWISDAENNQANPRLTLNPRWYHWEERLEVTKLRQEATKLLTDQ